MTTSIRARPTTQTMELVRFATNPADETAFLATRHSALRAIKASYHGLLGVTLVKLEATRERTLWMDVVLWESEEQAKAAAAHCMEIPEFRAWVQHISEQISLEHGEVVETVAPMRKR